MEKEIERQITDIGLEMRRQNNRGTSWPIFVVVEDKKIYGVDSDNSDGRERKEGYDEPLCERCEALAEGNGPDYPDDCDDCPNDAFVYYRIERDVPNMRPGFFFTGDACDRHIAANPHHYNKSAHSYAISAYHNSQLKLVMQFLSGKDLS